MTELSELKQIWNATPEAGASRPLSGEQLMQVIKARQESVRKRVQRMLRQEMWNYVVIVLGVLTTVFLKDGVWKGLIGTAVVAGLIGMVLMTLLYKERRLSRAPMGGSLKEALSGLLAMVDSTARAYLAAYMVLMVTALGMLVGVAVWKFGVGFFSLVVLVACAAGVAWAYRSGQAYVRRMFGRYRRELMECLQEVEAA
jgi:hypothetical protein